MNKSANGEDGGGDAQPPPSDKRPGGDDGADEGVSSPSSSNAVPTPGIPPIDEASGAAAAQSSSSNTNNNGKRKKAKVKESVIDHTYRDYSQVEVPNDDDDDAAAGGKRDWKAHPNFPAKLHAILSNPGYVHIIGWMPHGRSWKIVDKYLLTTIILPQHFAHAKFESFNRSVNGWGFKRLLGDGPDKKTYYHECFLRGRPDLTRLMHRLCNPGKRLPDKSGEPNFYAISKVYPLPELQPPVSSLQQAHKKQKLAIDQSPLGGMSQQQAAAMAGVGGGGGGQQFFSPQPHPAQQGYMYGYPHPMPYPPMPSPAAAAAANANDEAGASGKSNPPQQPPQMYWPQGYHQQPMHSPYGYYPYPQMMMAATPAQAAAAAGGMMMAPPAGAAAAGGMMMAPPGYVVAHPGAYAHHPGYYHPAMQQQQQNAAAMAAAATPEEMQPMMGGGMAMFAPQAGTAKISPEGSSSSRLVKEKEGKAAARGAKEAGAGNDVKGEDVAHGEKTGAGEEIDGITARGPSVHAGDRSPAQDASFFKTTGSNVEDEEKKEMNAEEENEKVLEV